MPVVTGDYYVDIYSDTYTGTDEVIETWTGSGTYSWTCPAGVFTILCECWAGGGGGGFGQDVNIISPPITYLVLGGGGGGGEYAAEPALSVTPGVTYTFSIGPAGAGAAAVAASGGSANPGGPTIFTGDSVTVTASGGGGGTSGTISAAGGAGGTGSTNTTHHDGGAGGAGNFSAVNGGGGGGSGGTGSAGSAGSGSGSGAAAVSGGGPGGAGGTSTGSPSGHAPGSGPGGGGGGAQYGATSNRGYPGGRGWAGQVRITWTYTGIADLAGGTGQVYASTSSPLGYVVNQWAGTIEQNQTFGYSAPGIQSCVVPLTPAASLGEGTGYPAAGNWLFAVAGWQATTGAAISIGDDSHQWWRPARTSLKTAASVTSIWYQPNIIPPAAVYAAPDAYIQGLALTVVEVAGLSPWDVVAGAASQHSNSSASLTMTLGAPSGAAFIIAAATGGNSGTFTSLAPEGWIPLQSVTAGNGTDTSGDAILQTVVQDTAGATSVTVTAGMAEPLSCAMVSVLASAPSPVPAGINPAWPYLIFEAAFGSGYGTHLDSMTWTNLQTQANGRRLRKWEESTGTQYELDQLEASELTLTLDNPDGALSPWNSASPWAGTVVPATPVRIRAVPPASAGVNRWYVISRNIERWPQSWDEAYRGLAAATATDVWSVINKTLATTYRAEVQLDSPYAWWPCDDSGLNDPRALVNAAAGNNKPLSITVMPGGLSAIITQYPFGYPVAYSATQAYAQLTGWMYGDPLSAAWQQAGVGLSSTGRYLTCKDSGFPAISSGITIEGWWNFGFIDPDGQAATGSGPYGQPSDADLALWNIYKSGVADNIGVAITLDVATGNVILEVTPAAGGFPDPITVAGTVDKRDASWMHVICTLSSSGYYAAVNGGFVGSASGTWGAGQAPASSWDTFAALALPGIGVGCGNAAVSHLAVYPAVLPPARIQAHVNAAYAAFGQIPPPVAAATFTANNSGSAYDPSGVQRTGQAFGPPGDGNPTLAAVACSIAGTFTSAPSSPETIQLVAPAGTDLGFMWLDAGAGTATSGDFAAARYQWFTASQGGSEQLAATTSHPYLYVNGFGSGITPPATASPLGDSVAWRIERLLQQGRACTPRCIDPASAACLAQLDTGGQVTGDAVNNIVQSDDGLLFVDNQGFVCYWSRPHLAAQTPVWQVGPGNPAALNLTTSFEGGAYPWTPVNGATLTTSAIWAESGTASALFSGNGATAGPGIQSENIYGIMAGTTYTASAWMYSTANYAAGVTVTAAWYNSSASLISQVSATPVPLTAGTAVQVTVTGAAPAGTAYAVITAATAGTPGAITHFFADAAMLIAGSLAIPAVPYSNDATWDTDPQHCYNDVEITQYDVTQAAATAQSGLSTGSGVQAGGLVFAPAASLYPQIVASQAQYGDCQYQLTSYLQSTAEIQAQANWLFENFGTPVQRITGLVVDAAAKAHTSPYSWVFILGVNVGDVITATMRQPGQPPFSGTWRITHIDRTISFGEDGQAQASAAIIADYWPPAEWT